jgi:GT2 family glycosyltransferase
MTTAPASLDIVIVAYNARDDLDACLRSLHEAPPARPHTIVVVDNASQDGAPDLVASRWPGVRLLRQSANLGFARANNVGIRATGSDLVLLLNSDTLVPRGALDALVAALEATPAAAVAGPRLVDETGRPELSFGRAFSPLNEARQKLIVRLDARGASLARQYVDRVTRRPGFPDWVSGACLLVWRRDAERAGLLDERYFMYSEDVDFCAALRARGRKVLFTPAAEVVHLRGRSRASAPTATAAAYRRSQVAYYEKHRPWWSPWLRRYLAWRGQWPPPPGPP